MKKETNMQDNIRVGKERKYWDKYAPKYDRGIEKYWGFYSALVDKISQDAGVGNTVLEVATGTGTISLKVAEQAKWVYGVDISPLMVGEAKKKMEEKGIFKLVAGFPVFHKFSFKELSNLVTESGFIIRNEEVIREMVFPIAYIVAELNMDGKIESV